MGQPKIQHIRTTSVVKERRGRAVHSVQHELMFTVISTITDDTIEYQVSFCSPHEKQFVRSVGVEKAKANQVHSLRKPTLSSSKNLFLEYRRAILIDIREKTLSPRAFRQGIDGAIYSTVNKCTG